MDNIDPYSERIAMSAARQKKLKPILYNITFDVARERHSTQNG